MLNLNRSILFLATLFLGSSIAETDLWTTVGLGFCLAKDRRF
jgi:hypothetical protein